MDFQQVKTPHCSTEVCVNNYWLFQIKNHKWHFTFIFIYSEQWNKTTPSHTVCPSVIFLWYPTIFLIIGFLSWALSVMRAQKVLLTQFQTNLCKQTKIKPKTIKKTPYLPIFAKQILQICSSGGGSQSTHPKVSTRTASTAT